MGLNQPINLLEKVVVVNNISDFPEPVLTEVIIGATSYWYNTITLEENVVYEFGAGLIDLGDNVFVITNGVKLRGQGITKTILTTMLVDGIVFSCPGDYSSTVEFEHFQFICNDPDVQLFDISFVQRVYFTGTFWFHTGKPGRFENIDTFRTDLTTAFVGLTEPVRFYGTNGAVLLDRTGWISINETTPAPQIISLEENATFGNIFQVAGCIILGFPGTSGIKKHPSVIFNVFGIGSEEVVYFGFNHFRGGLTPLEGFDTDITNGVVKSRFNFGLRDTHIYGSLFFHNPVHTVFAGNNIPIKAEGETTDRGLHGFAHSYNRLSYLLTNPIRCKVDVKAYLTAENTVVSASIYIAKYDALTATVTVDLDSRCQVFIPPGGAIAVTDGIYEVNAGDYFEIWLELNDGKGWVQLEHNATRMTVEAK